MDAMKRNPVETTMEMSPGQIERLRDASGIRLNCHRGMVWVTQEGQLRDDFLSAGNSLELVASGLTLIEGVGRAGASLSIQGTRSGDDVEEAVASAPRAVA
jgi:Protein of unknown function (DUF2917)